MEDDAKLKIKNEKLKIKGVLKLIRVWLMVSSRAAQSQLLTNWAGVLFLLGKVIRFLLFFLFLFVILGKNNSLVGYTREQVILFFLEFNLIDITTQFFFRGVYVFRPLVVSGNFDLDLLRPLPSFFRPIFGWTDVLDLITLIPLWIYFIWFIIFHNLIFNSMDVILFFFFLLNSLIVAFSLHLFVCSICLLTTEIDHMIMVYRDLTNMARFPTEIYQKGIQFILTFPIPIIILITVPAKALMGLLSWQMAGFSFLIGIIFLKWSFKFWQYSLKRYSSASS